MFTIPISSFTILTFLAVIKWAQTVTLRVNVGLKQTKNGHARRSRVSNISSACLTFRYD